MIEMQETPIHDQYKIHDLSIALGKLYAELYACGDSSAGNVLEAYIAMRRALPKNYWGGKRIGSYSAFEATQGRL